MACEGVGVNICVKINISFANPKDVRIQQGIIANVIIDHVIIVIPTCCHGGQLAWVVVAAKA